MAYTRSEKALSEPATIVYCHCAYFDVIDEQVRREVFEGLVASGAAFEATADLCGLAARRDPKLKDIAGAAKVKIVACQLGCFK